LAVEGIVNARQWKLIERIVKDERIVDGSSVAHLIRKYPSRGRELLPNVIARLERHVNESRGFGRFAFSNLIVGMDRALLTRYRKQVQSIWNEDRAWPSAPLLLIMGRLGIDPAHIFRTAIKVGHDDKAILGICHSDLEWSASVGPVLIDYATGRNWSDVTTSEMAPVILALRRFGSDALADKLEMKLSEIGKRNLQIAIRSLRESSLACAKAQ
jgi:hypothetical protein